MQSGDLAIAGAAESSSPTTEIPRFPVIPLPPTPMRSRSYTKLTNLAYDPIQRPSSADPTPASFAKPPLLRPVRLNSANSNLNSSLTVQDRAPKGAHRNFLEFALGQRRVSWRIALVARL